MQDKTKDELIDHFENLIKILEEKICGMERHIFKLVKDERIHKSTINVLQKQLLELKNEK